MKNVRSAAPSATPAGPDALADVQALEISHRVRSIVRRLRRRADRHRRARLLAEHRLADVEKRLSDALRLLKLVETPKEERPAEDVSWAARPAPGRPIKYPVEVLLRIWSMHFTEGVSAATIAQTLGADRKIIERFLERRYWTANAAEAYRQLGVQRRNNLDSGA